MAQPGAVPPILDSDVKISNPSNKALLALSILAVLPALCPLPANLNIIATASLCVYVGSWRSVKATPPEDAMTQKDAMKFPIIGSAVLLGLFLLFKFLPQRLVNTVLTAYFVVLGIFAMTVTIAPFFNKLIPKRIAEREYELPKLNLSWIFDKPLDGSVSIPTIVAGSLSTVFCMWYFISKHWLANNVLGLAFAIQGIEYISLGATVTGCILLGGLFFYDIFWVFFTPVMVSVARSFDAPIKLLFPRFGEEKQPFSMLGLGDIVIPGIFVALLLRYDVLQKFRTKYFYSTFGGYIAGLTTTIVVMHIFKAAQPALLYIVPAVVGALLVHTLQQGELKQVFSFSETPEKAADDMTNKNGESQGESNEDLLQNNALIRQSSKKQT